MNRKQLLTLLAVIILPFLFYLARPNLEGADSYYYLNQVCGNNPVWTEGVVQTILFSGISCSQFNTKLILLFCFGVSVFAIALLGELFDEKEGWLAGVFAVGLGPLLFWEFIKFENDQFAYPFLFFAVYFFFAWKIEKKWEQLAISALLMVLAGLIWGGSFYWLVGLSLSALQLLPIVAVVLLYKGGEVINPLLNLGVAYESLFLLGIVWLGLLIVGYLHIKKDYARQMLFGTAIMFLNAKYALIVVPYLAVSTALWLKNKPPFFKETVFLIAIMLTAVWGFLSLGMPPMDYQLNAIDYALQESNEIKNDWDMGYWIMSKGGVTENYGSQERRFDVNSGIIVTRLDMPQCEELERFHKKDLIPTFNPSRLSVAVYNCQTT